VTELTELTAAELAAAIRGRQVGPVEVVDAYLQRIDRVNPALNAVVTLRPPEELREEARRLEGPVRRGEGGRLAGVPFTVKDVLATAGIRTTAGSRVLSGFVPSQDATCVARLRAAGAILLGKTNCSELGLFPYTRNRLFGQTGNPVGPVTPGGSSGGESAAVAARCSALGLGTDFGGSLRWPASCTGVLALRPTTGRVPGTGQLPAPTLAEPLLPNSLTLQGRVQVIGPLARGVDDLEIALELLSGPDGLDPAARDAPPAPAAASTPDRFAWWDGAGVWPVRADAAAAVGAAAAELERHGLAAGAERPAWLDRATTLYTELRALDGVQDVRRIVRGHERDLDEDTAALLAAETTAPAAEPALLWAERDRLWGAALRFLARFPLLLLPVACVPAYDLAAGPPVVAGTPLSVWEVLAPCRAVSLLGLPSVAVPFGTSQEGWPLGVQLVGRPFSEHQLLAAARLLTAAHARQAPSRAGAAR
jgi:Asp-tRNA(Asn)/Glu-tRNA(Gln) amidotransferase A subunit family amidase